MTKNKVTQPRSKLMNLGFLTVIASLIVMLTLNTDCLYCMFNECGIVPQGFAITMLLCLFCMAVFVLGVFIVFYEKIKETVNDE